MGAQTKQRRKRSNVSVRRLVREYIKAKPKPFTSLELWLTLTEKHPSLQRYPVVKCCSQMATAGELYIIAQVKRAGYRGLVYVYSHEPDTAFGPDAQAYGAKQREWSYTPDSYDEMRNQETMASIPEDHLIAVQASAKLMRDLRDNYRSGPNSQRVYCDEPIRALFADQRDDRLEARYTALALWLSWRGRVIQ